MTMMTKLFVTYMSVSLMLTLLGGVSGAGYGCGNDAFTRMYTIVGSDNQTVGKNATFNETEAIRSPDASVSQISSGSSITLINSIQMVWGGITMIVATLFAPVGVMQCAGAPLALQLLAGALIGALFLAAIIQFVKGG